MKKVYKAIPHELCHKDISMKNITSVTIHPTLPKSEAERPWTSFKRITHVITFAHALPYLKDPPFRLNYLFLTK